MLRLIVLSLVAIHSANGYAPKCWNCADASSLAECNKNGYLQTCHSSKSYCALEIRIRGAQARINKRCKQDVACVNNQNTTSDFKECLRRPHLKQEGYCYCCCTESHCTSKELSCKGFTPIEEKKEEMPKCSPRITTFSGGSVFCSDEHYVGSSCVYRCSNPTEELYFPEMGGSGAVRECLNETKAWSVGEPCCVQKCPPKAVMDTAILLDSSASIGNANWDVMRSLVGAIIRTFVVGVDLSRYAIFRYNNQVDTDTLINFGDKFDEFGLTLQVDSINYDGSGTMTGLALAHLQENVLKAENGMRPGVPKSIIIITDGKSMDDPEPIARELRKQYNIIVVWIKNEGTVADNGGAGETEVQLRGLVSDPSNFIIFDSFDQVATEIIIKSYIFSLLVLIKIQTTRLRQDYSLWKRDRNVAATDRK